MAQKEVFTRKELEAFTMPGLRRLCKYFGIEYSNSTGKKRLINDILAYIKEHKEVQITVTDDTAVEDAPKRSVMVERIYKSQHPEE